MQRAEAADGGGVESGSRSVRGTKAMSRAGATPGAGLPWIELMVARHLLFPRLCRKWSWADAGRAFQADGARVLSVFDALPPEQRTVPVLVRRVAGMEDSSRFWSAAMVLEHLTMVGSAIRWAIGELRKGVVPEAQPRIADFKPPGGIDPAAARAGFAGLLGEVARDDRDLPPVPRGTGPRYPHPWFGPLDAHQWQCLLAFHQEIHRKQIERIRDGLGRR